MKSRELFFILARYLALLLIAIFCLPLIYAIFTPLTIYPVFQISKLLYDSVFLFSSSLIIGGRTINLIPACIAGSAYLLLLILNLTTPLKPLQRAKSIAFLFISFLLFNIVRIFVFVLLFIGNFAYFNIAHKFAWYFSSIILVIFLWFANVYLFKITSIPFFTDAKALLREAKKIKTPK